MTTDQTPLYEHARLRELTHEQHLEHLNQIRNRRLVTAIEVKNAHDIKMKKLEGQLFEQWSKQDERNRLDMLKIEEMLSKIERGINKQIELSHKLQLAEIGELI